MVKCRRTLQLEGFINSITTCTQINQTKNNKTILCIHSLANRYYPLPYKHTNSMSQLRCQNKYRYEMSNKGNTPCFFV